MHPITYQLSDIRDLITGYSNLAVLCDEHTIEHCLPALEPWLPKGYASILIPAGEVHKNIHTCAYIWQHMQKSGLDRHSLLINLGGGVIGDMGGFCASTYMRGIDFIQIPTTLLAMVDASVGGKLGVDLHMVKNMIGVFQHPKAVVIWTDWLKTLPTAQLTSGYAEVLKHGLIYHEAYWEYCADLDIPKITSDQWLDIVRQSVDIKSAVVTADPHEQGMRKILNFGHTVGHAIETLSYQVNQPLLHGYAIVIGMMVEITIAIQKKLLEEAKGKEVLAKLKRCYPELTIPQPDMDHLWQLMLSDKKNKGQTVRMAAPNYIGHCLWDITITKADVEQAIQTLLTN